MSDYQIPIGMVERETGLSQEVLRKWEVRYGFPVPARDARGVRLYSPDQVARLQVVKRLIDRGMRPARALALDDAALATQAAPSRGPAVSSVAVLDEIMAALADLDGARVRRLLLAEQARRGIEGLVVDLLDPLSQAVGEAWAEGRLQVRHEHLYAEQAAGLLQEAMAGLPAGRGPGLVLATPPGELHGLGLRMVAVVLALRGLRCLELGTQVPVAELVAAARQHGAAVVGVSFSPAYPVRAMLPYLMELRAGLPAGVAIWAGGAGFARLRRVPGWLLGLDSLAATLAAAGRLATAGPGADPVSP